MRNRFFQMFRLVDRAHIPWTLRVLTNIGSEVFLQRVVPILADWWYQYCQIG
ncbi:unnamed protein product [Sphenostylis stenocarpa]|uniref:Uncharacterized protein n=1 Tax=Sphenostylis stenocarpa TaxID=92480 RepID=A0AA86W0Q6_9FABA|nr:unnamed protein product [Sphenostylis stenocarpa]